MRTFIIAVIASPSKTVARQSRATCHGEVRRTKTEAEKVVAAPSGRSRGRFARVSARDDRWRFSAHDDNGRGL